MTTYSNEMTIETARELTRSLGMCYPDTKHNRKMMATATHEIIMKLHGKTV